MSAFTFNATVLCVQSRAEVSRSLVAVQHTGCQPLPDAVPNCLSFEGIVNRDRMLRPQILAQSDHCVSKCSTLLSRCSRGYCFDEYIAVGGLRTRNGTWCHYKATKRLVQAHRCFGRQSLPAQVRSFYPWQTARRHREIVCHRVHLFNEQMGGSQTVNHWELETRYVGPSTTLHIPELLERID
jgi:hypothetical protein